MSVPRILPLAAIAVGGVLALKALDLAGVLPDLLRTPSARAEEAAAKPGKPAKAAAPAAGAATAAAKPPLPPTATAAAPAKPPPPLCAPSPADLARAAGLSPAELQVIQSLSARRGQLDARESALDAQLQLLAAAEKKVDGKLHALEVAKAEIHGLLGQADAQSQAEVDRLVTVYEKMKPRDAGALMAQLDDKVRVPVAAKMKPAILAAVIPNMGTAEGKKLTELLARRFAAVRDTVQAATAPPPAAAPVAAATPAPGAKPTQLASAELKTDAATPAKPAASPAPKPQRVARAAPPRRPRAAKPAPVAKAEAKPEAETAKPEAVAKAETKPEPVKADTAAKPAK